MVPAPGSRPNLSRSFDRGAAGAKLRAMVGAQWLERAVVVVLTERSLGDIWRLVGDRDTVDDLAPAVYQWMGWPGMKVGTETGWEPGESFFLEPTRIRPWMARRVYTNVPQTILNAVHAGALAASEAGTSQTFFQCVWKRNDFDRIRR